MKSKLITLLSASLFSLASCNIHTHYINTSDGKFNVQEYRNKNIAYPSRTGCTKLIGDKNGNLYSPIDPSKKAEGIYGEICSKIKEQSL